MFTSSIAHLHKHVTQVIKYVTELFSPKSVVSILLAWDISIKLVEVHLDISDKADNPEFRPRPRF